MKELKKQILKDIDFFLYRRDKISVYTDAVEFNALDLSIRTVPFKQDERIERMNSILSNYPDEKEREKFGAISKCLNEILSKMLDHMGDHLGEIYMELSGGKKSAGQYFTPYEVSRLMAEMTIGQTDLSGEKVLTLNEPCCGSGGIIVATAEVLRNRNFNYTNNAVYVANDIDRNCTLMCYLQASWAAMPAVILHQDTLTQKAWDKFITPAYALQYSKFERALNSQSTM